MRISFGLRAKHRVYRAIARSKLFDAQWYLQEYPDVAVKKTDPLAHYIEYGHREGRRPNPLFFPDWYLTQHPYLNTEPLLHYIRYGSKKGFRPNPLFDPIWYLSNNDDVAAAKTEPLAHYLEHGRQEGRKPNPLFEPSWYLNSNPDVQATNVDPLHHYLCFGSKEGRRPNPIFDPSWYLSDNYDVNSSHMEPLAHYLYHGVREGRHFATGVSDVLPVDIYSGAFLIAYRKILISHVCQDLEQNILSSKGSICFLVPERFSDLRQAEGFCQRVHYVDDLLCVGARIYVNTVSDGKLFELPVLISPNVWQYTVFEKNTHSTEIFEYLLGKANIIYAHSVYSLQSTLLKSVIEKRTGAFVIDAHGAVPEEEKLYGRSDQSSRFSEIEKYYFDTADRIVVVTQAMSRFYHEKYAINELKFCYIPFMYPVWATFEDGAVERDAGSIVYCGGSQQWQMVSEMLLAMNSRLDDYKFEIMSSDVAGISQLTSELPLNIDFGQKVSIVSLAHSELVSKLKNASFGFVLRGDSVVNRVSSPTKLVDYVHCGVVPIMNFEEIGDFRQLGLSYVCLDDFERGQMPSSEERNHMAGVNRWVLRKMRALWEDGVRDLFQIIYTVDGTPALLIDDEMNIRLSL